MRFGVSSMQSKHTFEAMQTREELEKGIDALAREYFFTILRASRDFVHHVHDHGSPDRE